MDQESFLTTLYVMLVDFCQSAGLTEKQRPGPAGSLSCSEVVRLAIFGHWGQFPSERAFYRYAQCHLQEAFPTLPEREQFNRLQRSYREVIVAFALFLVQQMQAQQCLYEALASWGGGHPRCQPAREWLVGRSRRYRLEQPHRLVGRFSSAHLH